MGGFSSIGLTLLLISGAMIFIGAAWLAIGIRKFRTASRRRQDAWANLLKELPLHDIKGRCEGSRENPENEGKG